MPLLDDSEEDTERKVKLRNKCDNCGEVYLYVRYSTYFCMRLCIECLESLESQYGG